MRLIVIILLGFTLIACGGDVREEVRIDKGRVPENADSGLRKHFVGLLPTPTPSETKNPGVSIDQKFPYVSLHDFTERKLRKGKFEVEVEGYSLLISRFLPYTIIKDGRAVYRFEQPHRLDLYWYNAVGVSKLLGPDSMQIYVVAGGPGAVCCTNYWIMDITRRKSRKIFRSHDFGRFRHSMEIFDADSDGVYELVQFDSCFRYFMDDCGSCSPEPRAVFKYSKKFRRYIPARGIQQDFVRESMAETEEWIREKSEERKKNVKANTLNLERTVNAHVVDLLYLGKQKEAWEFLDRYSSGDKRKVRRAIKRRLKQCRYYQMLYGK